MDDPRPSTDTEATLPEAATKKQPRKEKRFGAEQRGYEYGRLLLSHIKSEQGVFLRDDDGSLHVLIGGRRIPLKYDRDSELLASLMLEACHISTLSMVAQIALQRVRVTARKEAGRLLFRRFSALSGDNQRLYIPLADGQILKITAQGIVVVPNGKNDDMIWLEHPYDNPPKFVVGDPRIALDNFERLIVETQACLIPEMKWFIAMHEALFPFVRDTCPARWLVVHIGPTQQGKTSGAQRFTVLHGLGEVKGDYSVAALSNIGDIGLLVMDNKEQANFNQPLIDFLLFLATGAERGRSREDGSMRVNRARPAGVITTIEGVYKAELRARCAIIRYAVRDAQRLPRSLIEREIGDRRHEMTMGLAHVLRRYMEIKDNQLVGTCPVPNFEEHYATLCILLRAYGDVAGKPEGWSESIIAGWDKGLIDGEPEDDDLEHPITKALFPEGEMPDSRFRVESVTYNGKLGKLYITECGPLLTILQQQSQRDQHLPKSPQGLSRRLRSAQFRAFVFLDEESAPELPMLGRTAKSRPIGFFVENDG